MTPRDVLTAVAVAVAWGLTFIAIKIGVEAAPPLAVSALRFFFAAVPLILFLRPPKTSPLIVVLYGLAIGVGQFGLLFIAIREGFPVGLSSLVIQLQVFFTILFAWALLGERPAPSQIVGALIAFAGIALIGSERLGGATFGPLMLVIVAAAFWGAGNVIGKFAGRVDMLAFTAWSSLVAPLPLLIGSAWLDGPAALAPLLHPSLRLVLAVLVLSYAGTVFGYGLWSRLLSRHSAAAVTPFALLVPVVGLLAGYLVFGEPLDAFELWGAVLVMAGLAVNVFGGRLLALRPRPAG
jgi:O-acetylserine/cysteine efflux transporter